MAQTLTYKPFDLEKMLQTIKDQLKKQSEERSYSEKKAVESIETRVKKLDAAEHTVENCV